MQEWMLMGVKPVYNSGFEKDEFELYAQDSFQELLDTSPIVDTITLYNSDLTNEEEIQCIIQDKLTDSQTRSDQRSVLSPIGTYLSNSYIKYNNLFWMMIGIPDNNKIYEKVIVQSCDWKLKWQNASGDVVERWCITSRQTSVGIDENKVIQIGAKQLKIWIPYDSETIKLRVGKRFYIDNNIEEPTPYEVTVTNTTEYVKNGHGYLEFVVKETATIPEVDRPDLMLCNYISPTTPPTPEPTTKTYIASISYTQPEVAAGSKFGRNFTAVFKDADGNVVTTLTPKWTITSTFMDKITATEGTNYIKIVIMDTSLIDKTFKLKLEATDDSAELIEMTILITSIYG